MNADPSKHDPSDDELLDRLIRSAAREEPAGFRRPADDLIEKYLLGEVSQEGREEVNRALDSSPRFRAELLAMIRDLDRLSEGQPPAFAESHRSEVPLRREFLRRHGTHAARKVRVNRFVFAAAAALVLVGGVALLRQFRPGRVPVMNRTTATWQMSEPGVDPGLLVADATRGGAEVQTGEYATPQEAALASVRAKLRLEGYRLVPVDSATGRASNDTSGQMLVISWLDSRGELTTRTHAFIPPERAPTAQSVSAWVLSLPSRNLYELPSPGDSAVVQWPSNSDTLAVVTWTFSTGTAYRAVDARMAHRK